MIPIWSPNEAGWGPLIEKASHCLQRGELVAMPTETVYGLAGNAFNPEALAKIFSVKRRPFFDPLILHVSHASQVDECCEGIPANAEKLMAAFWPGPLTLVLPRRKTVPDLATSGLSTVAVRQPHHPVALALIEACGFPLAAPSANPFGGLSPTRASHVASAFENGIAGILNGGACEIGVESTILGWFDGKPVLLRAGGLDVEKIESCLGKKLATFAEKAGDPTRAPALAPGRLPWHYAPATPLRIIDSEVPTMDRNERGLLSFRGTKSGSGYAVVETLSHQGDLNEAATRLFACLHRLDAMGLKGIDAEKVPEMGLGLAIMDRLIKASARPGLPLNHA